MTSAAPSHQQDRLILLPCGDLLDRHRPDPHATKIGALPLRSRQQSLEIVVTDQETHSGIQFAHLDRQGRVLSDCPQRGEVPKQSPQRRGLERML